MGAVLALGVIVAAAAPAAAHPLGNFTVNRYARVELSAGVVRVYYVLDEAEIPAFQERAAVASSPRLFAERRARAIASGLSLSVDRVRFPLTVDASDLSQPMGQGGLHTLRLAIRYRTVLPAGPADRPHADLIRSPLDLRQASADFTPGTEVVAPLPLTHSTVAVTRAGGRFAQLITRADVTPWVLAGMLGIAFLVGAAHALAPGHGKTVMAAYLVGTRGRPRDALLLGTIVSLMHTGSVLVLGLLLFHVSRSTSLDRLYPIMTLAGGVVVVGVGAWLLRSRLRALRASRSAHHHHHHDGRDHSHDHEHGHDHSHELPAGVSPLSRRGLVVLAGAGGVLPSPSAVIVLVSSFALRRVALGLALVGAFSLGLAATLTAVGLALVVGRDVIERRGERWLLRLPAVGASALVLVGSTLAVQGFRGLY